LASAILRDMPPPLDGVRSDVPADLAHLVRRCLEKDPQYRVQTTRDVGRALREISAAGSSHGGVATPRAAGDTASRRADEGFRVAVLPFRYSGNSADVAALTAGLSGEIVTALSRFSYLRVIAHGSTLQYSKTTQDVPDCGRTGTAAQPARWQQRSDLHHHVHR
jgi:hypothetical protein